MGGYYLYTCNNTKMTIPSSQIFARVSGRRNRETGRSFSKVYVRIRHQERALVTLLNNIVLNLWRLSNSVKMDIRLNNCFQNILQNIRSSRLFEI